MGSSDRSDRVCVIGAGSSGLAAARSFTSAGFEVDVLEACADLGGNWNYESPAARVYRSTHAISSRPGTEFPDYPMPESYPDYPDHEKILAYLRGYADHFDLERLIEYETHVERVEPFLDMAHLNPSDGLPRLYKHVFHPNYDNLFVAGLIQPDSGQFGIVEWQCRAMALYLGSAWRGAPNAWLKKRKRTPVEDLGGGVRYQKTYRHHLEVGHASYTRALKRLVRRLRRGLPAA